MATTPLHQPLLRGPVPLSHLVIGHFVRPGDLVVDATCGNGNDTLFLAHLVGENGKVWAFDIQQAAIDTTARKLSQQGLLPRVELIHDGHETMHRHLSSLVAAILFNLGYLPGGDHGMTTTAETTAAALEQSLELLMPGGIVAVTVYPGHPEGAREHLLIETWAARLEPGKFHAWRMGQLNAVSNAPYFIAIQRTPTT